MDVRQTQHGSVSVIALTGRVDYGNAEALRAVIQPAVAASHTVLDFSGLEYISSAGLRVLVLAARETRARGHRLSLCCLQPVVREIFAISRFDQVFQIHSDLDSALGTVAAGR